MRPKRDCPSPWDDAVANYWKRHGDEATCKKYKITLAELKKIILRTNAERRLTVL